MKKKQIIIGVILLISIASMIILIVNNNKKRIEKKTESTIEDGAVQNDVEIQSLNFSNIKLTYENGITTLTANVKATKKTVTSAMVKILFVDESGTEIKDTVQVIEEVTTKGKVFTTGFVGNYQNASKVKFVIMEEK